MPVGVKNFYCLKACRYQDLAKLILQTYHVYLIDDATYDVNPGEGDESPSVCFGLIYSSRDCRALFHDGIGKGMEIFQLSEEGTSAANLDRFRG